MIESLAEHVAPLLQTAAVPFAGLRDTVITRQVDPGWFERVTGAASGLMSITLLVLAVAMVPAAWNFRRAYKRWNALLEKVQGDARPLVSHAAAVADNLDYITTALRADVHRVNATVNDANERLQTAVRQMERRVQAFTALLDVAQQETERAFVTTAATVHGVRTSAAVLRDNLQNALEAPGDDVIIDQPELGLDDPDDEDTGDGYDDFDPHGPARPRVRPRRRPS